MYYGACFGFWVVFWKEILDFCPVFWILFVILHPNYKRKTVWHILGESAARRWSWRRRASEARLGGRYRPLLLVPLGTNSAFLGGYHRAGTLFIENLGNFGLKILGILRVEELMSLCFLRRKQNILCLCSHEIHFIKMQLLQKY